MQGPEALLDYKMDEIIKKHILDCALVAGIAALTSMLATEEITLRILGYSFGAGLLAGLIKFREKFSSHRRAKPNYIVL